MEDTPTSKPGSPQDNHFAFLHLPLELRRMIYREIFLPEENTPIRNFIVPAEDIRIYRNVTRTEKKHLAILLTNKEIKEEALDVLYEVCPVKLRIAIYEHNLHGAVPQNASVDHPFRRLRNVEIELDTWLYTLPLSSWWTVEATRSLAIFSDEMVYQGARLKNVVIRVPYPCEPEPEVVNDEPCMKAEDFERITEPLRRLKGSGSITLQCSCENRSDILPAFDRLSSKMRDGRGVQKASSCDEMVWLGLRRKAEPYLERNLKLRDLVSYGWSIVKTLGMEDDVDARAWHSHFPSLVRCVDRMMGDLHGPGWEMVTYEGLLDPRTEMYESSPYGAMKSEKLGFYP
ncbi:MAG: hypothetical protein Q9208_006024 [Pyrenodesmia sp. 3 TL-2023]